MDQLIRQIQRREFALPVSALLAVVFGVYLLSTWAYNLFFHPLAGFPGPKLAAATRLYEFYYDVIKRGQYVYKIEEMHKRYGESPCALHPYRSLRAVLHKPDINWPMLIRRRPNHSYQSLRDCDQRSRLLQ